MVPLTSRHRLTGPITMKLTMQLIAVMVASLLRAIDLPAWQWGIISPVLGTRMCFTVPRARGEPLEHVVAGTVLGFRAKVSKVAAGYAR